MWFDWCERALPGVELVQRCPAADQHNRNDNGGHNILAPDLLLSTRAMNQSPL
jgi:hypothetical protein